MKVSELKNIIKDLPDDMDVELFNPSYEWYGLESLDVKSLKRIDDKLVLNFCNEWSEYDFKHYQDERRNKKRV